MSTEPSLYEEREAAIAEIEARRSRRRLGIRWPTALLSIVLATGVLWMTRSDLGYYFSPADPLTLGSAEAYQFDGLASNRYAQIHGTPTDRGAFLERGGETWVIVGLQGTPVLVKRRTLPNEDWVPGRPPAAVDTRPFGARGRLLAEEDASDYGQGFDLLRSTDGVVPKDGKLWILLAEESPREDRGTLILAGFLGLFLLLNVWLFARDLAARAAIRRG